MRFISEPTLRRSALHTYLPTFLSQVRQMSDAEAIPGTSRSTWWLQVHLDAYIKLARGQVEPGSYKKCRGVGVPVPDISQALLGCSVALAVLWDCGIQVTRSPPPASPPYCWTRV